MKKSQIFEFLNDLKAAVRLGHPDSIAMALEGMQAMPLVAGNEHLGEGFVAKVIIPAGKLLATVSQEQLLSLLHDHKTAFRAVAGVGLATRFMMGKDVDPEILQTPAKDARPEVRSAFAETLRGAGEAHSERLLQLAQDWLAAPSARLRSTALGFCPALGTDVLDFLEPLKAEEHPEVRAALVDALQTLAQKGLGEQVLALLNHWGAEPRPNVWVICRVLSAAWAVPYPKEIMSLLKTLKEKVGERKPISNAVNALQRHGVEIEI